MNILKIIIYFWKCERGNEEKGFWCLTEKIKIRMFLVKGKKSLAKFDLGIVDKNDYEALLTKET